MNLDSVAQGTARRHEAILDTIRAQPVRSQAELRGLLRRRGFDVAQPTLSRDLRVLGLAKTPLGYVAPESAVTRFVPMPLREARLRRALAAYGVSVQPAGSLVVVRTPPAGAHPVARALDEAAPAEAVGTIAGEDTVFVATPSERAARALARRLAAALGKGAGEASA
jgi:transcriptional regulator of arginine metabolism